jgi:nuclear pore complex protein Nup155
VLLGVCTSPAKGGGSDAFEELSLQPMPLYSLPSDNVIMTCFAASDSGRIFLGGSDGHVYEVQYAATDSWRQRRCSKVRGALYLVCCSVLHVQSMDGYEKVYLKRGRRV